jgi:hypothetical protein
VCDEVRVAEIVLGGDWSGPLVRAIDLDTSDQQVRVTEHWVRAALMEHASVAAFARFTLQLLHLGAPRQLLERSQQAMRDEIEHARLCFDLAGRYLGADLGPGPLPVGDALLGVGFEQIVTLAFREGCLGETVAALEAHVACDLAEAPEVRRVLGRIVPDELRHAELAWDFVSWALSAQPGVARAQVAAEARRIERELAAPLPRTSDPGVPAHGVLSDAERAEMRQVTLREVVLPRTRALLGEAEVPSEPVRSLRFGNATSTWPA